MPITMATPHSSVIASLFAPPPPLSATCNHIRGAQEQQQRLSKQVLCLFGKAFLW